MIVALAVNWYFCPTATGRTRQTRKVSAGWAPAAGAAALAAARATPAPGPAHRAPAAAGASSARASAHPRAALDNILSLTCDDPAGEEKLPSAAGSDNACLARPRRPRPGLFQEPSPELRGALHPALDLQL